MLLFLFLGIANAQTTMVSGFTPAHAECINIKTLLCDGTCQAFDVPIAQAALSTLGLTELPAGLTSSTAGLWAQLAYAVTYNATAATMLQVYPVLDTIFECEARNAGLIWAEYMAGMDAITICKTDADCVTAYDNIRTTSLAMPLSAVWDYTPEMEWWAPSLTTSTNEQFCNVFFVALEENNAKALNAIQSALATMLPAATSNGIMEYCNGQGIIDLAVSSAANGFVPTVPACARLKSLLCRDADCRTVDQTTAFTVMDTLNVTSLPAGLTVATGGLWAQMAFAVTYYGTSGAVGSIHPVLNWVFECEAFYTGQVWANYVGFWKTLQSCQGDSDCTEAWTNVRVNSSDTTKYVTGAAWNYVGEFDWYLPCTETSTSDQLCNVFFAALNENNAKALSLVVSSLALVLPDGNSAMEYCNGQGVLDLGVSSATNGYVPSTPICARLKTLLCRDADCSAVDTNTAAQLTTAIGATELPAGMTTATGSLWAQFAFVVTHVGTGGAVNSIHPVMNWVFECDAFYTGQVWADYVGVWKATQTCMNDADCLTAWDNIRTKSISGDIEAGTSQDLGATWLYIDAIDWYVPDTAANVDANYCNMFFAALAEENAKATYLLSSMTALMFTPEEAKAISEFCNQDMTDFVVGIVTKEVVKNIIIFSIVGMLIGAGFTGLGCWCCNRSSKVSA